MMRVDEFLRERHPPVGGDYCRVLRERARERADTIYRRFDIHAMVEVDAWALRKMIAGATDPTMEFGEKDQPILARHADPLYNTLRPRDFFAVLGLAGGAHLQLVSTNTLRRYGFPWGRFAIQDLFEAQRLWCDRPDIQAPFAQVSLTGADKAAEKKRHAAIHSGTAFIKRERRSAELASLLVGLSHDLALIALGLWSIFGTIPGARRDLARLFSGRPGTDIVVTPKPTAANSSPAPIVTGLLHIDKPSGAFA